MEKQCKENGLLFPINLQLFAGMFDGIESSAFDALPAGSEQTEPQGEHIDDPQVGENTLPEPSTPDSPPQDIPTTEKQEQLNDLSKADSTEQDSSLDEPKPNENFDIMNFLNGMHQEINERLDAIQNPEEKPPEKTAEEIQAEKEAKAQELSDLMFSDPVAYREALMKEAKDQALEEFKAMRQKEIEQQQNLFKEQQKWNDQLDQFKKEHDDFEKYAPKMEEILKDNPHLQQDENPYDLAYKMAKYDDLSKATPKGIEDFLSNEDFKKQLLENPEVRKMVVESMKNNQAPQVISGAGGSTTVTPKHQPKSFAEARKSVYAKFGIE